MTAINMARRKLAFRLDERIVEAMDKVAANSRRSRNAWLENHLFELLKSTGYLGSEEEPLGETRGGDFTRKGKRNENTQTKTENNAKEPY